jgi:hypothetical protein
MSDRCRGWLLVELAARHAGKAAVLEDDAKKKGRCRPAPAQWLRRGVFARPLAGGILPGAESWVRLHDLSLLPNLVAGRSAESAGLAEVDGQAEQVFEVVFETQEVEEADRPSGLGVLEIDEDVEVAVGLGGAANARSVDGEAVDGVFLAQPGKLTAKAPNEPVGLWAGEVPFGGRSGSGAFVSS